MDGQRGGAGRHSPAYGLKKCLSIGREARPAGERSCRARRLLECLKWLADTGLDSGETTLRQEVPQLLRRAPLRRGADVWCVVAAEHQVVHGPSGRDVQQADALATGRFLVGEDGGPPTSGLELACPETDLGPFVGPQHLGLATGPACKAGDHGDRELQSLGTVNGEDADGVVVGLRDHGLEEVGVVLHLLERPDHEAAETGAAAVAPFAGLVDDEAQSTPVVARSTLRGGELDQAQLPDDLLHQLVGREPPPALVPITHGGQCGGDGVLVSELGEASRCRGEQRPPSARRPPGDQVDVGAGQAGVSQRRQQRHLVGRAVDGLKDGDETAHGVRGPHQRSALDTIGDVPILQRPLQRGQRRAGRQQDRHVFV